MPRPSADPRPGAESLPQPVLAVEPPRQSLGAAATWWSGKQEVSTAMAVKALVAVLILLICVVYIAGAIMWRSVQAVPDPTTEPRPYYGVLPPESGVTAWARGFVQLSEAYGYENVEAMSNQLKPFVLPTSLVMVTGRFKDQSLLRQMASYRQEYLVRVLAARTRRAPDNRSAVVEVAGIRSLYARDTAGRRTPVKADLVVWSYTVEQDIPSEENRTGVVVSARQERLANDDQPKNRWWEPQQ